MHLETTLTQLREMRLSVMADALQQRLEHGDQHGLSGEEFAALLIEDEYCARQQRKLARLIGWNSLPLVAPLLSKTLLFRDWCHPMK